MKKTYINPVSTVEHVQLNALISISNPDVTINTGTTVDSPSNFEAKGTTDWDIWSTDEEEY